ncbi:MAG: PTS sugar transporter subunit IIA [Candidatus Eisenbacteria sp.]|nr:PTS sugar transporter subunit IIA [Candidatus Eisenbacteria bacterium]
MLKLVDLINSDLITLDLQARTKNKVFEEMVAGMSASAKVLDGTEFARALEERESLATTGIGRGVAFPHARTGSVDGIVIAFARSRKGVDFDALDGEPVHLVFMMGTSPECVEEYLKVLARISRMLRKGSAKERLMEAKTREDVLEIIRKVDEEG